MWSVIAVFVDFISFNFCQKFWFPGWDIILLYLLCSVIFWKCIECQLPENKSFSILHTAQAHQQHSYFFNVLIFLFRWYKDWKVTRSTVFGLGIIIDCRPRLHAYNVSKENEILVFYKDWLVFRWWEIWYNQSTNWRSESVCKIISEFFFQKFFLFIKSPILNNILSYLFPDKDHLKNFCY